MVRILEVISHYRPELELRLKGKRFWGLCPFHNERTPSFSVDPEKGLWHCFGCQRGGGAAVFIAEVLGIPRKEAHQRLKTDFGFQTDYKATNPAIRELGKRLRSRRDEAFQQLVQFTRNLEFFLSKLGWDGYIRWEKYVHDLPRLEYALDLLQTDDPGAWVEAFRLAGDYLERQRDQ